MYLKGQLYVFVKYGFTPVFPDFLTFAIKQYKNKTRMLRGKTDISKVCY